jgi:small conductance mechanosensitive channel
MSPLGEYFNELWQGLIANLPALAGGVALFILCYILSRWLPRVVRRSMQRRKRDPELIVLFEILTRWGILILGIVLALNVIAPGRFSSLIAGLGVAGLTIGFALQDVAKNLVAGILLLLQQPFEIGDAIEVKDYGGKVLRIALRSTEMCTWDGRHVIIPNADILVSPIVNFSRATERRIELRAGVDSNSDLDKVARVAMAAVKDIKGLKTDPAPQVVFQNFGESAIEFAAYYWIDVAETGFFEAQDQGVRAIQKAFARQGIVMPFPTVTVLKGGPSAAA